MARRYRIHIDRDRCVGSTLCLHFASGVFALDDKGQSIVTDAEGDPSEKILEAAEQCPQAAIKLEDADTGEHVFP